MVRILASSMLAFALVVGFSAYSSADVILSFSSAGSATGAVNILSNGDVTARALADTTGAATALTVTRAASAATNFGSASAGPSTISGAAAAAGFTVAEGSSYHAVSDGALMTYTIGGLDPLLSYNFIVFGARATTDDRTSFYTLTGGASGSLQASANVSEVVTLSSIAGATSLNLTYTGKAVPAGTFGYINAVRISTAAIPEPSAIALIAVGGLGMVARRRRKSIA